MKHIRRMVSCLLAVSLLFTACSKAPTWQEQYDLGVRYLSEGNYAEAVIAFTAAIEIDPKQPGAYLGRASAYLGSGGAETNLPEIVADLEEAYRISDADMQKQLEQIKEHLQNAEYEQALDEMLFLVTSQENSSAADDASENGEGASEVDNLSEHIDPQGSGQSEGTVQEIEQEDILSTDWVRAQEWSVNGVPVWLATEEDIRAMYPVVWIGTHDQQKASLDTDPSAVSFDWNEKENHFNQVWFWGDAHEQHGGVTFPITECRGITSATTLEEFLSAIGFTEAGASLVLEKVASMEYDYDRIEEILTVSEDYDLTICVQKWGEAPDINHKIVLFLEYHWETGEIVQMEFVFIEETGELYSTNMAWSLA